MILSDISAFMADKDAEKRTVNRRKYFQSYHTECLGLMDLPLTVEFNITIVLLPDF